ncbi:MAG: DHH family phosphoesterase, partial [Methanomassiliicoccales archaeon]
MNDEGTLPSEFLQRVNDAISVVEKCDNVRIISHYDADGIASAGVVCGALLKRKKDFHVSMVRNLNAQAIVQILAKPNFDCLIISDMGSSFIEIFEKAKTPVIILDHHSPPMDSKGIFHLNPHIFGIDGMTGASASSLCQIFAVCIDDSNWEFLPVAFAGIVGDRQHVRGMKGINEYLLKVGCDKKIVEIRQGSVIQDGKIRDAIYYSVDPYFKGLSGNEDAVRQFLAFAGINPETLVQELNENDRRKLVSLLALRLLGQGCTLDTLEEVTQERIYFAEWKLYASELASILNACGRTGNESVGLGVTLRDEKSIVKATELRKIYKESILSSLRALE